MFKKIIILFFIFLLSGCSNTIKIKNDIVYKESMELQYAEQFSVDYYEDGYIIISVNNGRKYIVVPEGKSQPQYLDNDIIVLKRPLDNIYIAATAVMDMFRELDALNSVRFSSQSAEKWYIKEAQQEMEKGNILYAGKYNMPDYELIVSQNCSLAVENNMISHSPEVAEKLEDFGIPVFIDLSSYENHPLGRVEWIKLYGILLDKEEEANIAFEKQTAFMNTISDKQISNKTAVFFFIDTNGTVHVKTDYIAKVIELVGGKYIFDLKQDNRSSVAMQMEQFYAVAKYADYLIYNSTIDGEITSVEELLQKEKLLEDFKAVQQKNVWCTTNDLYQQSMSIGQTIEDIYNILSGNTEKQILYFYHLI